MLTFNDHTRPLALGDVLNAAFPAKGEPVHQDRMQSHSVHVIPQDGEPRWIIVGDPRKALPVLGSWNPWNPGSRLRWSAVKIAARLGLLPALPGVQGSDALISTSYWQDNLPQFPSAWTVVIHVGSPSHSRKAILFAIGEDGDIHFAAKAPLVSGAAAAIFNEARVLDHLKQFAYLPKVLFRDCERGVVTQSWLDGRPVSRGFTEAHLKLLSTLAGDGKATRVSEVCSEVDSGLNDVDFPFDRSVLARGLELLDYDKPLPVFVEHRDFAPWNLKWLSDGGLGLLDWEWAVTESLPWQDACRFFYLDDFHFKGPGNVWEQLTTDPLLMKHRRQFGIPSEALPGLTMRYLLRVLPMDWIGGNRERAHHTFQQIQFLLATRRKFVPVGFEGSHGSTDLTGVRNTPA
jgi:hypothetical protein